MNFVRVSPSRPRPGTWDAPAQSPVCLAHEPTLRRGPITIDPTACQIEDGQGRRHLLEPRLMQVLVALAHQPGRTISRDDLIRACWGAKFVTDESVASVIYRLRRVLRDTTAGNLEIETIRKVGFRLLVKPQSGANGLRPVFSEARRPLFALGATALLLAGYLLFGASRGPGFASVSIVGTDGQGGARFAEWLAADLATASTRDAMKIAGPSAPAPRFVVRVRHAPKQPVETSLLTSGRRALLWSASTTANGRLTDDVRRQIVSEVLPVLRCAVRADRARLSDELLKLYVAACAGADEAQVSREADNRQIALLREVTRQAPHFSNAWAELAIAEASAAEVSGSTAAIGEGAGVAASLRSSARRHVQRSRALDPALGASFVAEALLVPRGDWNARLRVISGGLTAAPDEPRLHGLLAMTSRAVGRNGDAVRAVRREVELDPFSRAARNRLVSELAYSGRLIEARAELEKAEQTWPGSLALTDARFRVELRQGKPDDALRVLASGRGVHPHELLEDFIRARREPTQANVALVRRRILKRYAADPRSLRLDIQTLVQLDLIDDAFALASSDAAIHALRGTSDVLFRSFMKPMWLDQRFMSVAARLGLARHWIGSGLYPDFCVDPDLPYDCRAEARRYS